MSNTKKSPSGEAPAVHATFNRRHFLHGIAAAAMAGAAGFPGTAQADEIRPGSARSVTRRNRSYKIRLQAALAERRIRPPTHRDNSDEELYPNRIGSYSKGLPHNFLGEVDPDAYDAFLDALHKGRPEFFEAIPMGCDSPGSQRKLVNPQSGLAFDLEGADSHALAIPPAPTFASDEEAGELVENYWMALTRDIPFRDYGAHPLIQAAAVDLSARADFRGPKVAGQVTPDTLFRGNAPGCAVGPYLSQFLLLPAPFGANYVEQRMRCPAANLDFLTDYAGWLDCQRGCQPSQSLIYEPVRRFIRNGRDLGQWVHIDVLYQAYFHALLILLTPTDGGDTNSSGMGAPFDAGNPYALSQNQEGFGTFGGPHIAALMAEVSSRALKAVWFQKWLVHRRLRPEAFAGRLHNQLTGAANYPISPDLLNSTVLEEVQRRFGSFLLPMAFPEGSPMHPAYGAGHATVAGACATILKAWFDESYVIPNPVVPSADGLTLEAYSGPPLTVGGELNKLAANVAIGRNIAGVHWRSDATESLRLGETVAISILRDQSGCYNEEFGGFALTTFDGTPITV